MNQSTTTVTTAPSPSGEQHLSFRVAKILVYLFIFIVSTLGNCTVIAIICRSRIMRSVAGNLFILNLALCDFLTPFLSIPFDMAVEENNGEWPYGKVMCKVLYPGATWTTTGSSLTLAAIAFERHRALMHPFKTKLTDTRIKWIIAGIHAFSVLLVLPYGLVLDVEETYCDELYWPEQFGLQLRQAYTMSLFIVQYVGPLLFMAYMYSRTSKSLFVTKERVRSASVCSIESDTRPRGSSFGSIANSPDLPLSRSVFKNIQQQQNVKITKMFIVVVIIFAIFMLPNQILWLWWDFGAGQNDSNFTMAAIFCRMFTYTNSCLNPFIFYKFSRQFQQGFRRVFLTSRCCVNRRRNTHGSTMTTGNGPTKTASQVSQLRSTSSVFEKEDLKLEVYYVRAMRNKTQLLQRNTTSPQRFWKRKISDNFNWVRLHGKPKEVVTGDAGKCGQLPHSTTKLRKVALTEENIEISVNVLMTLSDLVETCC